MAEYEKRDAQATEAMQLAARRVVEENKRLRGLLGRCICGQSGDVGEGQGQGGVGNHEGEVAGSGVRGTEGSKVLEGMIGRGREGGESRGHEAEKGRERERVGGEGKKGCEGGSGCCGGQGGDGGSQRLERTPVGFPRGGAGGEVARQEEARTDKRGKCGSFGKEGCCEGEEEGRGVRRGGFEEKNGTGTEKSRRDMVAEVYRSCEDVLGCCEGEEMDLDGEAGVRERSGSAPLETSCEEAVMILRELQRGRQVDTMQVRAALGCGPTGTCKVKNTRLFQVMDEIP